jgi:hypothetical protein
MVHAGSKLRTLLALRYPTELQRGAQEVQPIGGLQLGLKTLGRVVLRALSASLRALQKPSRPDNAQSANAERD